MTLHNGTRESRLRGLRERRLRELSLTRLTPNIVTLLALCAGLTAIRFALLADWRNAVIAICVAGVFDASDGRLARLLGASSRFGAELDSLSDVISFGVAPAVILFIWCMQDAGSIGWALVLLYCVCVALRLARFNTRLEDPKPPWAGRFFTGVPAPAGAGLVLLPMMLSFQDWTRPGLFSHWSLNAIVIVTVSMLLVSTVPTFSFKRAKVPRRGVLPLLLLVGLSAAFLVGAPWATLTIIGLAYASSIPLSIAAYRKMARENDWTPPADSLIDPTE